MLKATDRVFVKHIQGLFDPDLLLTLRERFIESQREQASLQVSDREQQAIARGESADKLRLNTTWYEVWKHPHTCAQLRNIFSPYRYVTYPVQVRHVREAHHHVPWHQDIGYMKLLGARAPRQVITCFIPIELKPATCTTIQFAFDNHTQPEKEYQHTALEGFGAGIVNGEFEQCHHFELALGDALVFGDHVLHRTYLPPGCVPERRSLEFRLILPEDVALNKDYFDLETQIFTRFDERIHCTEALIA